MSLMNIFYLIVLLLHMCTNEHLHIHVYRSQTTTVGCHSSNATHILSLTGLELTEYIGLDATSLRELSIFASLDSFLKSSTYVY